MAKEIFSIEGIEILSKKLDNLEKEMEKRIDKVLIKLALKVIADAKRLAPLDSGDLEAALVVSDVKKELKRRYIDFGTSPEVDHYATVQHEGFRKTKDGKVIYMSPGNKTESKPHYKGYEPGKKYLENAITLNERLIITELRKALAF
ncbi:HK97 gp10 family phage protein [Caldibacillus lycopersici]|uniref:HK97 gp10 family phage protein n=1 Tax=Perspicuibacillus lycopersici TaxID=1325689 RepID=A0AAE3IWC2_9BACI|nr:HK97 gp10 family phage protein [Perspicuibacillus lycopersici]MCU9614084.1 HK97 gp10 family phage protein [Perspicuibacillus lycopersici]